MMAAPTWLAASKARAPPTTRARRGDIMRKLQTRILRCACAVVALLLFAVPANAVDSVARQWNELLLEAIRSDFARPTVHARNLFHTSVAMWDAWAAYDEDAHTYLHHEDATAADVGAARDEAISYAAYRVLSHRFADSPGAATSLAAFDAKMVELGYDTAVVDEVAATPAALGNRIAAAVLAFGAADGSNEANDYANVFYSPVNPELFPAFPGNPTLLDPNRWQPLALDFFIDQSGIPFPLGVPPFQSPEWGIVTPFALRPGDLTIYRRDAKDFWVYHDPGSPPQFLGAGDAEYKAGFEQVLEWSSLLDPADGVLLDVGPGARGNNTLGTNDGTGHALNPATGSPYAPNIALAGDYYRVLAEFWADGPNSETPPGHWFVLANYVSDHPALVKKFGGEGDLIDDLEWDVALYLTLSGAVHDAAVSAWGMKGWYDYIRPVSAIRMLGDLGQRSDPGGPSYDPDGIELVPGRVEVVTAGSTAPGERHEHLGAASIGKIAANAWRGPDYIPDPETTTAGVGWILVENWWPYQRPSFVTPPFAGYVSGHSTFSRAAAHVLTLFTGDAFFPGGFGEFQAPQDDFLVFENGPSVDVTLRWATYYDASDECSLSRIYGGIHPPADDVPGRLAGADIGQAAFDKAELLFAPVYEQIHGAIGIRRAKITTKLPDSGKIDVRGTLRTGLSGPEDTLDVSTGLRLRISDGLLVDEVYEFSPDTCLERSSGRVRCISSDRSTKAMFKPKKAAGEYKFKIVMRDRALLGPVAGPVDLLLGDARSDRDGTIATCVERTTKVLCKE